MRPYSVVNIWNTATGQKVAALKGELLTNPAYSLAFGSSRFGIVNYATFLRMRLACGCELTPCGRGRACRSLRTTSCQTPLR